MTLTFYNAPLLTPDYKDVVAYVDDYLDDLFIEGRTSQVEVEDFIPSLTGETTITLPPFINTLNSLSHPNYVTFIFHLDSDGLGANPLFYGFVTDCDTVTTNAVRISITCDFVATFRIPTSAAIRGVLTKSTVARDFNDGEYKFPGYYSIPADFSKQNGPVTRAPLRPITQYRIVVTFQCYKNNTWPAADGKAFQVTGVSMITFTASDLKFGVANVNNFCSPAVFRMDDTVYDVISISRIQFVPLWMIPSITAYISGYLSSSTETLGTSGGFLFGTASRGIYGPFDFDITPTSGFNKAKSRLFIGNRQIKIPVADRHTHNSDTMARLSCYIALDGFHCTLETDGVTDISNLFDAPYIYNSDSELSYSSGDARQLSLVSAGVSGVAGIVSGTALLATGNPLGLVGIAQSGVAVAQAVNSAQYRGRDVVSTGSASAASELDNGIIYFIMEKPANGTARANDAALNGYACQIPIATGSTLYGLMGLVSAEDNTRYMMEAYVFAPGVRATAIGGVDAVQHVPAWALRAFEEILERGVRLWDTSRLSLTDIGNEGHIMSLRSNP